jgi:hypothetical protein
MYILTTYLRTDYDKRHTRPLIREGAPNWQDRNFLYIINIWSWAPDGAQYKDRPTDWPSVVNWPYLTCGFRSKDCLAKGLRVGVGQPKDWGLRVGLWEVPTASTVGAPKPASHILLLALASTFILQLEFHWTHDHILVSHFSGESCNPRSPTAVTNLFYIYIVLCYITWSCTTSYWG